MKVQLREAKSAVDPPTLQLYVCSPLYNKRTPEMFSARTAPPLSQVGVPTVSMKQARGGLECSSASRNIRVESGSRAVTNCGQHVHR